MGYRCENYLERLNTMKNLFQSSLLAGQDLNLGPPSMKQECYILVSNIQKTGSLKYTKFPNMKN